MGLPINPGSGVGSLTPDTADTDAYDLNPGDAVDSISNDPAAS